jgi:uncharacterized protein (TIGR03643 family)
MTTKNANKIVAMAWCDKTSFDAIYATTGLSEKDVISLMRTTLQAFSYGENASQGVLPNT